MKSILTIMILVGVASCSRGKTTDSSSDNSLELADAVEYTNEVTPEGNFSDEIFYEEQSLSEVSSDIIAEEIVLESQEPLLQEVFVEEYHVQKNDTLMLVAFKLYGDYSRWREVAEYNSALLSGATKIEEGMVLRYEAPAVRFEFRPSGNPYLVKDGDNLGKISRDTYGTPKHWRAIWKNNEPLIKNPDLVFAGFTIYTPLIDNVRDVASGSSSL